MQTKSIKRTCMSDHREGFQIKFTSSKKCSSGDEDLNMIFDSSMDKALKIMKKFKDKANDDSDLDDESENFNFENTEIRAKSNSY